MSDERRRRLDEPRNVWRIIQVLIALSVASVLADLFYPKHAHFGPQNWIGFDAVYGFVSCVALVLVAKQLRRILRRDEDYYD